MIAVHIGPDLRFALIGAPSYFAEHSPPVTPQDLINHRCINQRLPSYGGLYAREFEKDGRKVKVRVEGQLVFNNVMHVVTAAVAGFGLSFRNQRPAPTPAPTSTCLLRKTCVQYGKPTPGLLVGPCIRYTMRPDRLATGVK
jgi:DNA-binding transcriptional LysR family regulator